MEKLILASCSPRRSELLTQAGIPFETVNPDVNEECCLPADQAVSVLSARKAKAVGAHFPGRFILAADTLVALNGQPLGKPENPEEAYRWYRKAAEAGPANPSTRQALMHYRDVHPCGSHIWKEAVLL